MTRVRSALTLVTAALVLVGCSGGSAVRSVPAAPARSTTTDVRVVRGQSLALHAMAYLASNPVSPVIGLFARAPVAIVVGSPTDVLVQPRVVLSISTVWVGMRTRRLTVHARGGRGRIAVATVGCSLTGTTACDPRLVYAPSAFPIGPAPVGGIVSNRGFTLHLGTSAVQPGRYELMFPIRYASNASRASVLDVADTLHVRLDVGSRAPSTRCTVADLHRPTRKMPAPHVLADTVVLVHGDDRLDPPPPGAKARIPATVAWSHLSSHNSGSGGTSSLVLALLTTITPARPLPDGTYVEENHNVLAWVLYTHNQALDSGLIGHGGPLGPTARSALPSQPCQFLDGIDAMNATTGQELFGSGGTAEHDPIRL